MTKTLTEQWREGTLPEGYYYTKLNDDGGTIDINYCWDDGCFQDYCDNMVVEVLAPVPSYDEWEQAKENLDKNGTWYTERSYKLLEKKLEIATKALKEYAESDNWFMEDNEGKCWSFEKKYPWRIGFKALKEMEGVK